MTLDESSLHLQVLSEVRRILISRYTVARWHLRERPPYCDAYIHSQILCQQIWYKMFFLTLQVLGNYYSQLLLGGGSFLRILGRCIHSSAYSMTTNEEHLFNPKKRIIFTQIVLVKGHHRLKSILFEGCEKIVKAFLNHPFWNCI